MAISTVLKLFIPTSGTIEMGNIQTTAEITTPKRKAAAAAAAAVIPRWLGVCKKIIALCTSWKVSVRMHFVNIYTTVCILLQILLLVLMGVLLELIENEISKTCGENMIYSSLTQGRCVLRMCCAESSSCYITTYFS